MFNNTSPATRSGWAIAQSMAGGPEASCATSTTGPSFSWVITAVVCLEVLVNQKTGRLRHVSGTNELMKLPARMFAYRWMPDGIEAMAPLDRLDVGLLVVATWDPRD